MASLVAAAYLSSDRMSEPKVNTTSYPAACKKCGNNPVTLVSLGDPDAPNEKHETQAPTATITVMSHYQFLSCEKCGESWNLPSNATA